MGNHSRDVPFEEFYSAIDCLNRIEKNSDENRYVLVGGMAVQAYLKAHNVKAGRRKSKDLDVLATSGFIDALFSPAETGGEDERSDTPVFKIEDKGNYTNFMFDGMKTGTYISIEEHPLEINGQYVGEKLKVSKNLEVNVLNLEHLVASKIASYNPRKRMKDGKDVMALVPIVAERLKNKKFSFEKVNNALKDVYIIRSLESQELYKAFACQVRAHVQRIYTSRTD